VPKVRDIIKEIEADGWTFVHQESSHRHYKHPNKPGKVTVNGQFGEEVSQEHYYRILRQAGLRGGNHEKRRRS
jgi:predicted RNA binding protein YcfA (HicA-like mRNA interferase family)